MNAAIAVCWASEGVLRMDVRGEVQHDSRIVSFLTRDEAMDLVVLLRRLLAADASESSFDLA